MADAKHESTFRIDRLPENLTNLEQCCRFVISELEKQSEINADVLDNGFMICDLQTVHRKLQVWKALLPMVRPYYAIKCCPDPMVTAVLGNHGAGFDCASVTEIELALKFVSCDDIIYANPQRAEADLAKALQLGVRYLTFDGPEELRKIAHIARDYTTELAMIVRILVPDSDAAVPLGEKFGATLDTIPLLADTAKSLDLTIVGVSFHCGSGNHDPAAYRIALELAAEAHSILQCFGFHCHLIDIGGGYPGYDDLGGEKGRFSSSHNNTRREEATTPMESLDAIANMIKPTIETVFPQSMDIIAEPGRYFVESSFALCSKVYKIQERSGRRFCYICHGVQGLFKDRILCKETFRPFLLTINKTSDKSSVFRPITICGPSGENYDIIMDDAPLPDIREGDWLVFDRMGAYTLSIASKGTLPPVYYLQELDSLSCQNN